MQKRGLYDTIEKSKLYEKGRYFPMNSNPRGVQTPPRPQPTRQAPVRQPARQPQHPLASVSKGFWVLLAVTVILLASMLVAMTILLCMADEPRTPASEPSGGGQTQSDNNSNNSSNTTPAPSKPSTKTGISLPSATKAGTYVYDTSAATEISGIQSNAAVLINVTGGKAVASKNGNARIYPASMTKVMTVLLACEKATDPTALLTVTDEMIEKYKRFDNPSTAHTWQAGYQVTVEDALYMAIYKSDTYACWLLAEHVAGSEEAFAQMMNARAAALGCTDTNFKNCTGLFDENHYTTCVDMAAIMAAAMNNAAATKVLSSTDQYTADIYINGTKNSSLAVPMWSGWYTGRLEAYPYVAPSGKKAIKYAGAGSDVELIGGKTGYETIPTNCFVTAGRDDQTQELYVCVQVGRISSDTATVNSKTSTDDTRKIYQDYAKP